MNAELGEFLRSQWSSASPTQYGSGMNPIVEPAGQRLPNGTRTGTRTGIGASGMGSLAQAPPIGTTPEVAITAETLGVPQPNCGPKMQAVIDPATGQWTCQPVVQSGGIVQLLVYAGLGYLAWKWWSDREKGKHHKPTSEESDYE